MVALLTAAGLTDDEQRLMSRMLVQFNEVRRQDDLNDAYYEGSRRVEHIGLAIPPELRRFETVFNMPRTYVDELVVRMRPRRVMLPGQKEASQPLMEGWDANNLEEELPLLFLERYVFGRGFVSLGTNEDDRDHPFIRVEPTRQMACVVEQRTRRMLAAMRWYIDWDGTRCRTLYMPNSTIWLQAGDHGWEVVGRDNHNLGRVPIVLFLNRRRAGQWTGVTEMEDVKGLTDACVRSLTNLQIASETHSVPQRYVLGVDKNSFIDPKTGKPVPRWDSYFNRFISHASKDVVVGQLTPTSLDNFHKTVDLYARLVASSTGLPVRYFGQSQTNPPSEGSIGAEETRFIAHIEKDERSIGVGLGWVSGLYERFRTGEWVEGNRIKVDWFNPGTPTFAQKADAVQKLHGGGQILSLEGSWDELEFSEDRKDTERDYMEKERDPFAASLADGLATSNEQADSESADLKAKSDALGILIRAGVDPEIAAERVGLTGLKFAGATPVALRMPKDEAASLEER